ncbi:hypothetical protein GKR71_16480 [Providencia sp. wls1922]|uniref:hypothetical protein n=1 Tax=Providencia sp. wls1922 TaxID=2675152 RepID=UPI0012B60FA5|nr:hypothetical protein [Providencia sp. wls1922]MTC47427.1 hypothetical protein [Providencia sp. wls1922]
MVGLNEVFGVSSNQIRSYVERDNIDIKFSNALTSGNHIVVYGASKQGKTALVSRHLPYENNIVVRLTPNTNISDIYSSILRQLGVEIETITQDEESTKASANIGIKAKAKVLLFGEAEVNTSSTISAGDKKSKTYETIPFNLSVAQDISELLHKINFNKKIILENFHYLDEEKQRELSFDLRTFQETNIIFVILGVWRKKDRLRSFCSDLTDRVDDIPVEPWTDSDFRKVIEKGCQELNITISESIILKFIANSFGSVGVLQELLKVCCRVAGVNRKHEGQTLHIACDSLAEEALEEKCNEYRETHQQSLELLASGNITHSKGKEKAPLHLPYYLVRVIAQKGYNGIVGGLSRADITDGIKSVHHRAGDVRPSDISNLLHNISHLQFKKKLTPPLLDYDQGKKLLFAIDSTFFFFLKNSNLVEFEEELPSPLE